MVYVMMLMVVDVRTEMVIVELRAEMGTVVTSQRRWWRNEHCAPPPRTSSDADP